MLSNFADSFDKFKKYGKLLAGFGGALAVMQIVMIFLPKQPSAEELAVTAAVKQITARMEAIHSIQMTMLS